LFLVDHLPIEWIISFRFTGSFLAGLMGQFKRNKHMMPEIIYVPSAFKHEVTKDDIVRAFETFIYEDMLEDFDNKHLLLGFNVTVN